MFNEEKRSLPFSWWIKLSVIIFITLFSILYVIPSFLPKKGFESELMRWVQKSLLPDAKINLGLDLKGGVSLTLDVEVQKAIQESVNTALSRVKELALDKNIKTGVYKVQDDLTTTFQVDSSEDAIEVSKFIADQTLLLLFDSYDKVAQILYLKPNTTNIDKQKEQIVKQAINTVRNRIDQFGVTEPSIFQQGEQRIVVELPGMQDIERAKELLGNTAKLDFRLVLNSVKHKELYGLIEESKKALGIAEDDTQAESMSKISKWLQDKNKLPINSNIMLYNVYKNDGKTQKLVSSIPYLVEAHSRLTGELIQNAQAMQSMDSYVPEYSVSLDFKPLGAKIFGKLTKEAAESKNEPHQLAIVLDGQINSAPTVNAPILGGRAKITLGNSNNLEQQREEAENLALVLRSGALPAKVAIVEERQIGPSEGAENISAGINSSIMSAALVIIIMFLIYGSSGLVANFAMLLNVLYILAVLALFNATLTLPGIAGVVLTMAIAVDGNVIINERIREELQSGKSRRTAFYNGYRNSLTTLIDANLTTAVAGLILLIYGNPAVKGFAVTLLFGIFSTMFTSYYVTEVIGQWLIEKTKIKRFG
jgi:protein-export membrane protein SecD